MNCLTERMIHWLKDYLKKRHLNVAFEQYD